MNAPPTEENPVKRKRPSKRNEVSIAIGQSLKTIRIAANKSQEKLAFEAGVDRTYISGIERGAANPSVLTLANICFALGCTLSDLFLPVLVSLPPDEHKRRANRAQPTLKEPKTRLR